MWLLYCCTRALHCPTVDRTGPTSDWRLVIPSLFHPPVVRNTGVVKGGSEKMLSHSWRLMSSQRAQTGSIGIFFFCTTSCCVASFHTKMDCVSHHSQTSADPSSGLVTLQSAWMTAARCLAAQDGGTQHRFRCQNLLPRGRSSHCTIGEGCKFEPTGDLTIW